MTEDPSPEITDIRVDGDTGAVTAKGTKTKPTPPVAHFVKSGGDWKVKIWFTTPKGNGPPIES